MNYPGFTYRNSSCEVYTGDSNSRKVIYFNFVIYDYNLSVPLLRSEIPVSVLGFCQRADQEEVRCPGSAGEVNKCRPITETW